MSLRMRSVSEGNGPAVSWGVTAHCALVLVVVAVLGVVVVVGLVGDESPQPNANAAPAALNAPRASRRPIIFVVMQTARSRQDSHWHNHRSGITRAWFEQGAVFTNS